VATSQIIYSSLRT